ncbi:unnamed protein product, partial [Ectocarpus fasciculatus]
MSGLALRAAFGGSIVHQRVGPQFLPGVNPVPAPAPGPLPPRRRRRRPHRREQQGDRPAVARRPCSRTCFSLPRCSWVPPGGGPRGSRVGVRRLSPPALLEGRRGSRRAGRCRCPRRRRGVWGQLPGATAIPVQFAAAGGLSLARPPRRIRALLKFRRQNPPATAAAAAAAYAGAAAGAGAGATTAATRPPFNGDRADLPVGTLLPVSREIEGRGFPHLQHVAAVAVAAAAVAAPEAGVVTGCTAAAAAAAA